MIADAHFLREQDPSAERNEGVEREKRRVMFKYALSDITMQERNELLRFLNGGKRE